MFRSRDIGQIPRRRWTTGSRCTRRPSDCMRSTRGTRASLDTRGWRNALNCVRGPRRDGRTVFERARDFSRTAPGRQHRDLVQRSRPGVRPECCRSVVLGVAHAGGTPHLDRPHGYDEATRRLSRRLSRYCPFLKGLHGFRPCATKGLPAGIWVALSDPVTVMYAGDSPRRSSTGLLSVRSLSRHAKPA